MEMTYHANLTEKADQIAKKIACMAYMSLVQFLLSSFLPKCLSLCNSIVKLTIGGHDREDFSRLHLKADIIEYS